jgi:tetratricopeptide (TPR) repeat protein
MPLNRREFLTSTAVLPLLAVSDIRPVFADAPRPTPAYLALQKFIQPGFDEFPEEKEAARIVAELDRAFRSGNLPNELRGQSPFPASYRSIAPDLRESVFDPTDTNVRSGWQKWVRFFKSVRRAQFYSLPGGFVRFEVAGEDQQGVVGYRVGQWKVEWENGALLSLIPVEEHVALSPQPWFHDVTADAFSGVASFQQLVRGVPYWRARLDPATGIDIYGSNGISVGDIDNDGSDEIYVCQPGGLPNRLYKVPENGLFSDITEQWGVGILDDTSAALFLDLRNSGRQDLVVLTNAGPILFLNEGGHFRLREDAFRFATAPAGNFTGIAAADFDRDGKLDLYLCCYVYFQSEAQYTYASPYQDAQNGPPNFLFRNRLNADGSGFFEDATEETGMNENNNRFSFAPAWCDFNEDGWPDLFVANDFGRKNLYVNKGGHFRDMAAAAGVEDIGPGMSASWFDYDQDGKADLYVANMWTDAGQRVIADPHFGPSHTDSLENAYQRHTMGNSLYRNRGDGTFEETTKAEHASFGRWAWSSGGHDLDNDGKAELFITCGMLTNESTTDLNSFFWRQVVARSPTVHQPSAAYENGWNAINQFIREDYSWNGREPNVLHVHRGNRFYDFSGVSGLDHADDSRAFAITDFDGDGRPDIILKSRLGPQVRVLQNDCSGSNRSIAFELRGTKSNRDAIGARIQVDGQTKWLEAGSGFLSQHSKRVLFGLGSRDTASEVHITWPSGAEQRFQNLQAGHTYRIEEGSSELQAVAFRPHRALTQKNISGDNQLLLEDTWFFEPVPLPEKQKGPGLFLLSELPASPTRREQLEIFRRYLFDWRTSLKTPFALLLNQDGHAVKIYANPPTDHQVQADLRQIENASRLALPFAGQYVRRTHRDFFKFGAAYLWAGYSEQALPYLEQVLHRHPQNVRVLVLVGQIHQQANRLDAARKYFEDAVKINPNYPEAWAGLGDVCDSRNNPQAALENYRKALALEPDLFYALMNAGHAADMVKSFSDAESFYRRAQQLDPKSPEAFNGLGLALAKQRRAAEAAEMLKNAIELKPSYADAINNLGVLYIQEAKVNDAIAAFEYGIRVAPDEDILYLNLGRTYVAQGRFDKAREVMHQLLDRKPDDANARRILQALEGR